ncbi:MAG: hypothetical protein FJ144_27880 [Deltaproteobacteria bacterium]|nr:hypothetical protein [Deltaproteobacteria bacterium]
MAAGVRGSHLPGGAGGGYDARAMPMETSFVDPIAQRITVLEHSASGYGAGHEVRSGPIPSNVLPGFAATIEDVFAE